ncbi:hypothetical protein D3C81_1673070 [compost metagenome]
MAAWAASLTDTDFFIASTFTEPDDSAWRSASSSCTCSARPKARAKEVWACSECDCELTKRRTSASCAASSGAAALALLLEVPVAPPAKSFSLPNWAWAGIDRVAAAMATTRAVLRIMEESFGRDGRDAARKKREAERCRANPAPTNVSGPP